MSNFSWNMSKKRLVQLAIAFAFSPLLAPSKSFEVLDPPQDYLLVSMIFVLPAAAGQNDKELNTIKDLTLKC